MSQRLRDFIKAIRAAKTAAEERELISKESAIIRTQIKDEDTENRARNAAKLLYIQLLGYPTHWAQLEPLKLIVSPHYTDKRLGYLSLMLLLDEKADVLLLVTNSLKNDLLHVNQYIVGLALTALGNICSEGMARDTAPEVEKLLNNSNPYIRKKAALCTIRILRKVPDLIDSFIPRVKALLNEKNHGVLLTAVSLIIEMCKIDSSQVAGFRKAVPQLVKILRSVLQYGYSPDYDVSGITDPFLQVKILRVLKVLGTADKESSDAMSDLLASIATNTDNLKNVGNAILYECVNTIMSIESESGLRVLAINILGRFLANRDNNIRYVALNTLCKVVSVDTEAVQRHRNTVVDCLKDNDISIRRRALELIYSLVNESNVRVLVRELINFLLVADVEFRSDLTAKLCMVTEKYAPTPRWHVDTVLKVMSIAGQYVPDEVSANLVALIATTADLHIYAVQKMFMALNEDSLQQTLVHVAVWTIGEFGDKLVTNVTVDGEETQLRVSDDDVLNMLEKILHAPTTKTGSKRYILTALVKLITRLSPASLGRIRKMIEEFKVHLNAELQQRAVEYGKIFDLERFRSHLLARMPVPEPRKRDSPEPSPAAPVTTPTQAPSAGSLLLDEILGGGATAIGVTQPARPTPLAPSNDGNLLLMELLGTGPTQPVAPTSGGSPLLGLTPTTPTQPLAPLTPSGGTDLLGSLLGGASVGQFPTLPVADTDDGLVVTFDISKPQPTNPQNTLITATFSNKSSVSLTEFDMKAAVPKYLKLALNPASATLIPPNRSQKVTQQIKIANSMHGEKPLVMKLRFDFKQGGVVKFHECQVANFPQGV